MVEYSQTPEERDAYYIYEEFAVILATFVFKQFSKLNEISKVCSCIFMINNH